MVLKDWIKFKEVQKDVISAWHNRKNYERQVAVLIDDFNNKKFQVLAGELGREDVLKDNLTKSKALEIAKKYMKKN